MNNFLTKTQLQEQAPALFETGHADRLTHIYKEHNGEIIMDLLSDLNWHPVRAVQAKANSRTPEFTPSNLCSKDNKTG